MHASKSLQMCLTLCNPMDYSLPGFSVHGILQARMLEWVAMPSSRGLPDPGIKHSSLRSPHLQAGSLPPVPPGETEFNKTLKLGTFGASTFLDCLEFLSSTFHFLYCYSSWLGFKIYTVRPKKKKKKKYPEIIFSKIQLENVKSQKQIGQA